MDVAVEGGNFVRKRPERGPVDQEIGGCGFLINADRNSVEKGNREIQEVDLLATNFHCKFKYKVQKFTK